jgi:hypothetical protein
MFEQIIKGGRKENEEDVSWFKKQRRQLTNILIHICFQKSYSNAVN